jgi:site-specific recombinase XerD
MPDESIERFVEVQSSKFTRMMYLSDLRDWESHLRSRGKGIIQAVEQDGVSWRSRMEEKGLAPVTISRKISVARSFYEFLKNQDFCRSGFRHDRVLGLHDDAGDCMWPWSTKTNPPDRIRRD